MSELQRNMSIIYYQVYYNVHHYARLQLKIEAQPKWTNAEKVTGGSYFTKEKLRSPSWCLFLKFQEQV